MKTIGIVGWSQGDQSFGATKAYLEFLKFFSPNIIILSPNSFIEGLDLLVLPGGKDLINGGGGDYSFWNSDGERFLEHFDKNTLPKYIEAKTPIYGICRGMQTIMRHFGVPLEQHLYDHSDSKDLNDTKANKLKFGTEYFHLGKYAATVGSWHHQGVKEENLSDDFNLIASSEGIVEFASHKTLPIIVEQSHPERNCNKLEVALINHLLKIEELEELCVEN